MRRLSLVPYTACCLALWIAACAQDSAPVAPDPEPPITLLKLAEATDAGVRIELFAEAQPVIGANPLHVVLTDIASGERLRAGTVTVTPAMDMPGAPHTAPCEQPAAADTAGRWSSLVVLTMTGAWKLDVSLVSSTHACKAALGFTVGASRRSRAVIASDGEIYIVTLVQPRVGDIGLNPCEVLLHKQVSLTHYPPILDASVDLEPFMPSMNHGSPANVDPQHTGMGHYVGKVNFTMLGDWRMDLDISMPDPISETTRITLSTSFDIAL